MNMPIQSRPVLRTAMRTRRLGNGVGASGDGCSTGSWCCADIGTGANPQCISCKSGICWVNQAKFCQLQNLQISDQC